MCCITRKIVKSEVTQNNDIPMVLHTLGLANPVCETLVNKYLNEGWFYRYLL